LSLDASLEASCLSANNFAGLSPMSTGTVDLSSPGVGAASRFHDFFHDGEKKPRGRAFWVGGDDDDSSFGSLDYSLADTEDETDSDDESDEAVVVQQPSIVWNLPRYHPDDRDNDCFKLPAMQCILSFFRNHLRLSQDTMS
jgi:hypothetical protein